MQTPKFSIVFTAIVFLSAAIATAAPLTLNNGDFDADPDLGGVDDQAAAPTGWFTHHPELQTWADFRFGNDGNGAWTNNGIAFGQTFFGPNFDPGPEDGAFYTLLGQYGGEVSVRVDGFGYNRVNGNAAGAFEVGFYFSRPGAFAGADGTDVDGSATSIGKLLIDISALTGATPRSQAFNLTANFGGSGIGPGDDVWLRVGDGPDNGNTATFDEPIVDNLRLTVVVPEPAALSLLATLVTLAGAVTLLRNLNRGLAPAG
jgi:hypothetical protein